LPTEPVDGATPILVGIVARAHGLRGEVVVDPTTDAPGRFAPGRSLTASASDGTTRTLTVATSRPFGQRLLVRFDSVDSRDAAQAMQGVALTIRRDEVEALPEGRFYRFELVGLEARTPEGTLLGRVEEVFATGANDVLTVRGAGGEILIPLLDTVVRSVDLAAGSIVLDPPPGLPGMPGNAEGE